jgi:hypothetical protein
MTMSPTFVESYMTADKSAWGEGPWSDEPDKVVWVDEATNLDCMAVRNHHGAWCGYVGVPEGHPAYGRDYDDVTADVHGGLSYAGRCQDSEQNGRQLTAICHQAQPGRPEHVWWVGFDCMHFMDYGPAMAARERVMGLDHLNGDSDQYRTLEYVVAEVGRLARQLAAL